MKTAKIVRDSDCESPRECDNLGTLCLFHRHMDLPNESGLSMEGIKAFLADSKFDGVQSPVYMYDHSGVALSTSPFSCPWDSGQVGVIYANARKLQEEFPDGWDSNVVKDIFTSEVEEFGQWLNGETYGYIITEDGVEVDSCWGFIGRDCAESAAKEDGAEEVVFE